VRRAREYAFSQFAEVAGEARRIFERLFDRVTRILDRRFPASASLLRLEGPFQKMHQQAFELAAQRALLTPRHRL
jgi:hypothetical protein